MLDFPKNSLTRKSTTDAKSARAHGLAGIRLRAQQVIRPCRPLLEWLCEDGPIMHGFEALARPSGLTRQAARISRSKPTCSLGNSFQDDDLNSLSSSCCKYVASTGHAKLVRLRSRTTTLREEPTLPSAPPSKLEPHGLGTQPLSMVGTLTLRRLSSHPIAS